jgi:hypothetical protein
LKKIGTWNSTEGLKMAREQDIAQSALDDGSLRNKTFVVITALVSMELAATLVWTCWQLASGLFIKRWSIFQISISTCLVVDTSMRMNATNALGCSHVQFSELR